MYSEFNERLSKSFLLRGLIGGSLAYHGVGYLEHDVNAYKFINSNFKVGDLVSLGNRCGVLKDIYSSEGEVVGLLVQEPLISSSGISDRLVVYHVNMSKSLDTESLPEGVDVINLFNLDVTQGLYVHKLPSSDISSFNSIAKALVDAGYNATPSVPLEGDGEDDGEDEDDETPVGGEDED